MTQTKEPVARMVPAWYAEITPREREVLELIIAGKTTKEIAFALGISPSSVGTMRWRILTRLKVRNSVELTLLAVRDGLVAL